MLASELEGNTDNMIRNKRYNRSWFRFLKGNCDFSTSLVLKDFCGTTTEPQKSFIGLRKERNNCQNLVLETQETSSTCIPKIFFFLKISL